MKLKNLASRTLFMFLSFLCGSLWTFPLGPESLVIRNETYERLRLNSQWKSYKPEENPFKNWTVKEIKDLFQAPLSYNKPKYHMSLEILDHALDEPMPDNFDSRVQWPKCLRTPRVQGKCGSCWAFAASSALSDKFCVASNQKIVVELSPQDFVSCDKENYGCNSGKQALAWKYLEATGLVTEQCFQYNSTYDNIPTCLTGGKCQDPSVEYRKYKAVKGSTKELKCPHDIQQEILKNGPVPAAFLVAEDFMHYKGGIYKYDHGEFMGGHAIKIVGWGRENEVNFWIVENSWGPDWGENGYFRIQFGEQLIDSNAFTGQPDLESATRSLKRNFLTFLA